MSTKTEIALETAKSKFIGADGNTKLPGSIIGGFTESESRAVKKAGWVKRAGGFLVVTVEGYRKS